MIRALAVLMLWVPTLVSAQIAPDPFDVPLAVLPPCPAPLIGVCYEFTSSAEGWHVPAWSFSTAAHARPAGPTLHSTAGGGGALRIEANFPPRGWGAAVLELREIRDLWDYETLVARVRVGGEGEFALRWAVVVGSDWTWAQAPDATPLREGEWTDVSIPVERLEANLAHVRRLIVRVESTGTGDSDGPVAVDFDFIRFVVDFAERDAAGFGSGSSVPGSTIRS
jgi:hypothetical protein